MRNEESAIQNEILRSLPPEWLPETSFAVFMQKLQNYLNDLINHDFHHLVQLLYRLDISEKKLKQMLHEKPQDDAAALIASAIVQRQLEKIESRKKFRTQPPPTDDEDKW